MALRFVFHLDDRTLRFPLVREELVLGCAEDCDIVLPHFTISRHHARLLTRGGGVEVLDLDSTNGTLLEGLRIEGAVLMAPGQRIAFGSVEASLEEVAEKDLEAAVTVEERSHPRVPDESVRPETPATASLGAVKRFTLEHLPILLQNLARGSSPEEMAQAVGCAVFDAVPCLSVEVLARTASGESVVFAADRCGSSQRPPIEVPVSNGTLTIHVGFASAAQERGYAPLVQACSTLISLAGGDGPVKAEAAAIIPVPVLPEPATVVTSVRKIYADSTRVARGEICVLIRGDSGTGKEVLARYIHRASLRREAPFVPLNCAALPRDLLEAELFGIERGTATGVEPRPGKFELADGGTLFLDEIADMVGETQAKILRVLQEGKVYRLGAQRQRSAKIRLISATNRDLHEMLSSGEFRTDLFHRIADWEVELPLLRERMADIPNLAAYFLAREARRRGLKDVGISRAAMETLATYHWPGNIRQLEREMARTALFLEDGQLVERSALAESIRRQEQATSVGPLEEILENAERRAIQRAVEAAAGNIHQAAQSLGIGQSTLYRRMRALGVT